MLGDFNVVCRRDERRGVNEEASATQVLEMFLFNNFIGELEVEDLNVLGRRYTWYHTNGRSMSRIDRVLISEEWSQAWWENSLWVLSRDVFDHCPLVLKHGGWDWGPKPFRFNNFWLENLNFKGVVEEAWRNQNVSGWMSFVLKEKLKGLKVKIKEWNKEEYGGMEERVEKLVEEINDLDELSEEVRGLSEGEEALWKRVLVKKYGEGVSSLLDGSNLVWPRYASLWWKEVVKLGDYGGLDWFNSVVKRKVGNGLATSFWNDRWRGDKCFRLKYLRLFSVSNQKEALVGEMREISEVGPGWKFLWRRNLLCGRRCYF